MPAQAPRFLEPVGRVQTPPEGLLHLLGMKSSGQQPIAFPQVLQPTLELGQLYRAWHQEWSVHSTAQITAVGLWPAASSIVPAGELWIAEQVSCTRMAAIAAATTVRIRLAVYEANSGTPMAISPNANTSTTGEIQTLGWDGPIVLKAGYGLAIVAESGTFGTGPTHFITFRGVKLSI